MSLQLDYICTMKSPTTIDKQLGKLPRELSKIYEDIYSTYFNEYEETERSITDRVFKWLLCSQQPLEAKEFLNAVTVDESGNTELSKEALLDLCFNFVVYDNDLDVFRFAHLSAREFLESKETYELARNHAVAAQSCLTYLFTLKEMDEEKTIQQQLEEDNARDKINTFEEYACWYWASHCAMSGHRRQEGRLSKLFHEFISVQNLGSPSYSTWTQLTKKMLVRNNFRKNNDVFKIELMISSPPNSLFAACV